LRQLQIDEVGTPRENVEVVRTRSKTRQEGNQPPIFMQHSGIGRDCPGASPLECCAVRDRGLCPVCMVKEVLAWLELAEPVMESLSPSPPEGDSKESRTVFPYHRINGKAGTGEAAKPAVEFNTYLSLASTAQRNLYHTACTAAPDLIAVHEPRVHGNGNFMWATAALEQLNRGNISLDAIGSLPPGLERLYAASRQIKSLDPSEPPQ